MFISSLLWGICSSLDSGLLATAVEVSKSRHNSTIKLLIQNSPISFQDNTALSLHCTFQALIFSTRGDMRTAISRNDSLSHKQTHDDYRMPRGSAHAWHNNLRSYTPAIISSIDRLLSDKSVDLPTHMME